MDWNNALSIPRETGIKAACCISAVASLAAFCMPALAANLTYSGHIITVVTDEGGAVYSGTEINEIFSGAVNDATLEGFITDTETAVQLHCCVAGENGLTIKNNEVLGAAEAALLSQLTGGNYMAGDMIDLVNIESGATTPGGGFLLIELSIVFDASQFSNDSLENYPIDPDDILVSLVFGRELNSQQETIFEVVGLLDELVFNADGFIVNSGLNDAWVSADAPLQGLFFTIYPDLKILFLSWFTFDTDPPPQDDATFGAGDQRWVTGFGAFSEGAILVNVELTSGGIFNGSDPVAVQQPSYGIIRIGFINCSEAVLYYEFPSVGRSGYMKLTRVVPDNVALCQALVSP